MVKVTVALNGRILQEMKVESLEALKAQWEAEAEIANATRGESPNLVTVYYANAMQVVSRDALYGSVLTAWTENTSDAVSYQVLEMG